MDRLRLPFFIVALVLLALVVATEAGSALWLQPPAATNLSRPGIGIAYLALVDGILLFTLAWFGLAQVVPARVLGAVHGIVTFVCMLLLLVASILLVMSAVLFVVMMVTLLLAVPFGTLAYFAAFAHFDIGDARTTLGVLMVLKVAMVVCLFLAQQSFFTVKGLVLLLATSLVANVIVSFLHGLMPVFLASILDGVAAIVVGVLASVWALVKLFGSVPAVLKGIRIDRHVSVPQ